jgi:hypothetical protein
MRGGKKCRFSYRLNADMMIARLLKMLDIRLVINLRHDNKLSG